MKIAIFTARLIYGGGEKVQNWLAHQLLQAGFEVDYYAPMVDEDYIQKLKQIGLYGKVTPVQFPLSIKKYRPLLFFSLMRKLYLKSKVDAILIFGGSLLEELAAKSLGIKVILAERCNPRWRSFPSRVLKHIQYHFGDAFVFQTKEQSECYSRFAQLHCMIILNPIIDERPLPTAPIRKEIVTVGRLSAEKNIIGTLNAFAKFHQTYSDYRLIMYGSGPMESEILTKAKELEITESICIIKGKTNISEIIEGAAIFIFNSTNEGMPNALIEAMNVGLACISSDCPIYGPRAIIQNGENGSLVPVGDDNALYSEMCKLIGNPNLANRYRNNSLAIRQKLNQKYIAKMWVEYFKSIVVKK